MTRSTQDTPAVEANCSNSSSDSTTGQSVSGISTPIRMARCGAWESRPLIGLSSLLSLSGIYCSAKPGSFFELLTSCYSDCQRTAFYLRSGSQQGMANCNCCAIRLAEEICCGTPKINEGKSC